MGADPRVQGFVRMGRRVLESASGYIAQGLLISRSYFGARSNKSSDNFGTWWTRWPFQLDHWVANLCPDIFKSGWRQRVLCPCFGKSGF